MGNGTTSIQPLRFTLQALLSQHVRDTEIKRNGIKLLVDQAQPGREMLDPIRPIDQIQMRDPDQSTLILTPFGAPHGNQAIIGALDLGEQIMAEAEHAEQMRRGGRAVGEISRRRRVGRHGVEALVDERRRQLRECPRRDLQPVQQSVQPRQEVGPDVPEQHVRRAAAAVRRRHRRQ